MVVEEALVGPVFVLALVSEAFGDSGSFTASAVSAKASGWLCGAFAFTPVSIRVGPLLARPVAILTLAASNHPGWRQKSR